MHLDVIWCEAAPPADGNREMLLFFRMDHPFCYTKQHHEFLGGATSRKAATPRRGNVLKDQDDCIFHRKKLRLRAIEVFLESHIGKNKAYEK